MARAFGVAALLFGLASIVSLNRGIDAAGGLSFGWFQGETEPLNSWRRRASVNSLLVIAVSGTPTGVTSSRNFDVGSGLVES